MTKRKSIISIGLVLMFVVMAFVMVGCGPTSTETISESFTAMYEKLDAQNEVLRKNDSALNTEEYYNLTYGETVDGYIAEEGMPSLFTGSGAPQNQEDMGDYYFDSTNLILYKKTDYRLYSALSLQHWSNG